jgi:hypothetical protein
MKKLLLILVVVLAVTASSCSLNGSAGSTYAQVITDSYVSAAWTRAVSGYDSGISIPTTLNTDYKVTPGTQYAFGYYVLDYDGYYYPSTGYYYAVYSISANPGTFLKNGTDKYLDLELTDNGLDNSGLYTTYVNGSISSGSKTPKLGTFSWAKNGLTITETTSIIQATPEQIASMHFAKVIKK